MAKDKSFKGSIEYLNTQTITDTYEKVRTNIKEFDNCVDRMEKATADLLDTWDGKGRNRFETEYEKMKMQLKDISDALYDIYNDLVDATAAYIDGDEAAAKQLSINSYDNGKKYENLK